MAWVLERDKAREGVWLEPLLTASDPQLFGTTAQAGKRGTLGRAGALCGALPSGRRGLLAVPWSLADKRGLGGKRALIDREREQLWPPPRADWLSCARLCPSGWLLLPNSTAAETQPASAGTVAAAAVAADDGPTAKRARHGGGGGGGAWPVRCASAAQPSAEPHDGQAAARAEPAQSQPAQRTDSPQPAFAEAEHGSYAASAERYERYAGGDAGTAARGPSALRTPSRPRTRTPTGRRRAGRSMRRRRARRARPHGARVRRANAGCPRARSNIWSRARARSCRRCGRTAVCCRSSAGCRGR
jgi:hypothetical protein